MSLSFSKSKYCGLWQCPKIAWLRKYKPDQMKMNEDIEERMRIGNVIGDLAMGIFGDYTEVTAYKGEKIDLSKMIENTKLEMAKGTPVICEASFDFDGLYCAVDILRKENGGWAIYEVKSSTHEDKQVYAADVAYQKYVLESCGVNVTGTYIVCINNQYVFDGTLDISEFFKIADISEAVLFESANIRTNLDVAELILKSTTEPSIDLSTACNKPYRCGFWDYCSSHIPTPSVFNLYNLGFDKKIDFYKSGKIKYEDLILEEKITNKIQKRQMSFYLHDPGTYVDKDGINKFLNTLSYPLYFLDFETMMPVIPIFKDTKPYEQIPVQYSLHYIEKEDGELKHREFLAEADKDPRRALAERLCEDIPMNCCVTVYNKNFECTVLKNLAALYPDLADHLLNIRDNIKDFLVPFRSGYYYNRALALGGKFSLKTVLPALFPDDTELDYHNLEQIHNGSEAMNILARIKDMPEEEQETTRRNLLKYCELDTYATVKIWQELKRVAE